MSTEPPNWGTDFVDRLLDWYEEHGRRGLPWRAADASPFEVLVAELMLQQTSARQVLNVYDAFVETYPTPESILETPRERLADDIEPLGLRKRTRYFYEASEQLVAEHDGAVPNDRSELLELRGVGEYTAASVLAHGFEKDVAAVDTNVARVLSRVFGLDRETEPEANENWVVAELLLPPDRGSDYVHAFIDFGAAVCTATDPNCESCPAGPVCEFRRNEKPTG
ncbi:base excision DNA repair protein [Halopiger xanaduensis]|uniref:Adenine DNA glycosylase n=1 Tax=Halopiger xanaduensis (strain DSM 18323 / JCM 14033 / SH-6) TaxID=797210 RepID=F8D8M8_HALXS|nr:base excision DNA repair protein [Halopiger xanaduensis]AEH36780.1 HhH-GPD family protein [Halopiger xanaduensis SH-6]